MVSSMRFDQTDYNLINKIREHTGITMNRDAVRFALRVCVEQLGDNND